MGLSESKAPFEETERPSTPQNENEIGICPMWDPRSPSTDFDRTPVFYRNERKGPRDGDIGVVCADPRSPSNEITRTPVGIDLKKSTRTTTDNDIESELRMQLERLQIYDNSVKIGSTENLGNDSESTNAVTQQKTVLKLLEEEPSASVTIDSLWLPNTPPCPKSRSTPKEVTPNSPESPTCQNKETDDLIKKRKARSKKQHSQKTDKLQKKVLKKAFTNQSNRSPLADRNGMSVKEGKWTNAKTKSTAFVKYRKYNSLDESFSDSFVGKENEQVIW